MGTMDFTFFTSFHSKRSRASWYWYAAKTRMVLDIKQDYSAVVTPQTTEEHHGTPQQTESSGVTIIWTRLFMTSSSASLSVSLAIQYFM